MTKSWPIDDLRPLKLLIMFHKSLLKMNCEDISNGHCALEKSHVLKSDQNDLILLTQWAKFLEDQ